MRTWLLLGAFAGPMLAGPAQAAFTHAADPEGETAPPLRSVCATPRVVVEQPAVRPVAPGVTFVPLGADPEGDMPRELAYTADGAELVVVNRDTNNVMFFDATTREIIAVVPVGQFPVHVAVAPDNSLAVVANVLTNDVSLIDIATHSEVARVPVSGQQPYRVAITPDSGTAIVGVINDAVASQFSLIDLSSRTEVATIPSTPQGVIGSFYTPEPGIGGNLFTEFALSPDGTTVVLPDRGNNRVATYDVPSATQAALLPVDNAPMGVDISADSTQAIVAHYYDTQRVTLIDLTTNTVSGVVPTGNLDIFPRVRLTPPADHALLSSLNDTFIINIATGVETARFYTGAVGDIELSFDGQFAIVSNYNFRIIELATQTLVNTIPVAAVAEAATNPAALQAAALNNRFGEDVHFYDINGTAGFLEGVELSGPGPEADACHNLAISPDGRLAVVANNTSRNVTVVDICENTIVGYVDVGRRPLDVAITPDSLYAVVCAADDNQVVIIDLATMSAVATLPIYSRPSRVSISPDGQMAYVLNVAGSDQVSFIQLDGANSSIVTQLPAGQTGLAYGYSYGEISGMTLSPDGTLLAVCDSFNDQLRLYDTATRTLRATVAVGDFPIRAAFSPDSRRAFVANAFSDDLSVVEIPAGGTPYVSATVAGFDMPLTIEADDQGFVYLGAFGSQGAGLFVIDPNAATIVAAPDLGGGRPRASALSPTDGTLYLALYDSTGNHRLVRLAAQGPTTHVLASWTLSDSPSDLAFHNLRGEAIMTQPVPDGIDLVRVGCDGDLDGDRQIGLADLAIMLSSYGQAGGAAPVDGDLDCDGDVDLADLAQLLVAFGSACN